MGNGIGGLVKSEKMFALFEQFRFRGVEVFGFAAIEAATTEADHTTLAIVNRHDHPMAETVVKTVASLTRNHKPGSFQQLGRTPFNLLKMFEQTIPLVRGITELERLLSGHAQA